MCGCYKVGVSQQSGDYHDAGTLQRAPAAESPSGAGLTERLCGLRVAMFPTIIPYDEMRPIAMKA